MKIDFTKVIEKLPSTMKAASGINPLSRSSKKTAEAYPTLGDVGRFKNFPDNVDNNFIALYRESLDNFLVPYIAQGEFTVSRANKFIENLVEQIFGNKSHFGLFSYLKERNYENSAERELVRTAERLINSGWRVLRDKNTSRYKIINSEGSTIIDATGPSEFFDEAAGIKMDESAAHLFIDSSTAAKIESIARSVRLDADSLTELDSLDSLLLHTDDNKIKGYISNYQKMRGLLKRTNSYPTLGKGISFSELYENGFVLSHRMIFSDESRVVMTKDMDSFILYPIGSKLNLNHGVSKDMLAVIASNIRMSLFRNLSNLTPQTILEIKEFNRVVALMSDYWDDERVLTSYADMYDSFKRMDSYVANGEISKDFYNKLFSSFAALVVTESLLLGNHWFSLSSVGFEPVHGKFYSFLHRDYFTVDKNSLDVFINSYAPEVGSASFSTFLTSIYPFRLGNKNLSILIENLPKEYFSALDTINTNIEGYPVALKGVTEHLQKAIAFIKSRGVLL